MKRSILIITFLAFYTITFCQNESDEFYPYALNKIEVDQSCFFGMTDYSNTKQISYDSLNLLPARIQFKAKEIINSTMTDFLSKVNFIGANVIDLDSWEKEDTIDHVEKYTVIPKYELHYQLCDTLLGIKSYSIDLDFDQFGQVLNYSWSTDSYSVRKNFLKPEVIKKKALEFAKRKKHKTKTFFSELVYDKNLNKLCWHVSFLYKTTYQKYGYTKKFKTVIIDITSDKHIRECETYIQKVSED